jgi:hypothetical protein
MPILEKYVYPETDLTYGKRIGIQKETDNQDWKKLLDEERKRRK